MKKTSVLLILLLVISLNSYAFDDITDSTYKDDISELKAIGIISGDEYGNFNPDECLTRAEFAKIICAVDGAQLEFTPSGNGIFGDLPTTHWAYKYIFYVVSRGYMSGDGKGYFRPDDCITGREAVRVLVSLAGWDYKAEASGGYPYGYERVAGEIKILSGVDTSLSEYILREEAARFVNNALDSQVSEIISVGDTYKYQTNVGKTVLSQKLHMKRLEGIVEATDSAGIQGNSLVADGYIRIDGVVMLAHNELTREYLGHRVKYIYSFDEIDVDKNALVFISDSKNKMISINAEDYVSFENNRFTFGDEKLQELTVSQTADYILNGDSITYYDGLFDSLSLGSISFISTQGNGNFDIVSIKSYKVITLDYIDGKNKILVDKYNPDEKIDLGNSDTICYIKDYNENDISMEDIKQDDVITAAVGKKFTFLYVGRKAVTGKITEITGNNEIAIDSKTIKKNYYFERNCAGLKPGSTVTVYLDFFGNAAEAKKLISDGNITAYLVKLGSSVTAGEETVRAKLFNVDGSFAMYEFNQNMSVNGENIKSITLALLADRLQTGVSYDQLVSAELKNGKISAINTARTREELTASDDDGLCLMYGMRSRNYFSETKCYDFEVYIKPETPFMVIPQNPQTADEKEFKIMNYTSFANGAYEIAGYTKGKNDVEAEIVVSKENVSSSFEGHDIVATIASVARIVDEDGASAVKFHVLKGDYGDGKTERDIIAYNEDELTDGKYNISDLMAGDIVKIMYDREGRLQKFQVYYKYNASKWLGNETESKTAINRVYRRAVSEIRKGYVFLNEPGNMDNFELQKLSELVIIVIRKVKNSVNVTLGTESDVLPGDSGVLQTISRMPFSLILFK